MGTTKQGSRYHFPKHWFNRPCMFRSASLFIVISFTVAVFTIFATSNVDSIVGIPHKIYSMQRILIHIKADLFVKCAHLHPVYAGNLVARSRYYHCHWTVLVGITLLWLVGLNIDWDYLLPPLHYGLMWTVGIPTVFEHHWQSPCTALTAGLCKGTVKESNGLREVISNQRRQVDFVWAWSGFDPKHPRNPIPADVMTAQKLTELSRISLRNVLLMHNVNITHM